MKKYLTILLMLIASVPLVASDVSPQTMPVRWIPDLSDKAYFEVEMFKEDGLTLINSESEDIVLSADSTEKTASTAVYVGWRVVSSDNADVYLQPNSYLKDIADKNIPWFIYIDGFDSNKSGVETDPLIVYRHRPESGGGFISDRMEGADPDRRIIIEADLSNITAAASDDKADLVVGIRSI